jgi:hypothetical protein
MSRSHYLSLPRLNSKSQQTLHTKPEALKYSENIVTISIEIQSKINIQDANCLFLEENIFMKKHFLG